jgi:homotetrameric NADPH-dependent glutamate synthase
MYKILDFEQFSDTTFRWDVHAPDVARAAQPGHFVILRLDEWGERIPLTIADFDRQAGSVTLVVQAIGKSTRKMLKDYRAGSEFADFAGPLGLPSHIEKVGHVVLVGGGLGVAPVFPQLRRFQEVGNRTTSIIGFRGRDLVFWEERFRRFSDELIVCTDDGSYGKPGFVTAALAEVIQQSPPPDLVVAVGPLPMMRACAEVTRDSGVKTVVSLNAIMVDGTGMCGSCRVTVGEQVKFACVDGPEFDAHQVDFEELTLRQARFKGHESEANEDYQRICSIEQTLFELEKRNYKKIKDLSPQAMPMPERPAEERSRNFEEVNLGYTMADAIAEAERCIQCVRPLCIAGCPVSIDIPGFLRHVVVRDFDGALEVIRDANIFPSICGRVCPQESQCEAQCIVGRKVESVAIGRLERFVGDHARAAKVKRVERVKGKAAIVGSGPGGLSCAADLAKNGVDVTIYEALHVAGGVLSYGIPAFRLPRETIRKEIDALKELGVKVELNKVIGKTFTIQQMLGEMGFNAVFIATGAGYPVFLGIPGEFAGQVYSANEFLTRVNLMHGDQFPLEDTPVALGSKVVVIGAGNTAMDCLRVARRLGAESVHCVYRRTEAEVPARIEELRHAKEEGIAFHWLRSPVEIVTTADGGVTSMRCQVMELGEPDDSGRRRPQAVEGAFETIECDTVIYALGTRANPIIAQSTPGLATRRGGYIVVNGENQATSLEGVFAGGDIVTGGATVILAMGAGRKAAAGMLDYLQSRQWRGPEVEPADGAESGAERLCPRCRRPLSGDEDYVCCGDDLLMWQCRECSKVYEGFAFPYGMCSACGGELEATREAAEVADEATRRAVRQAFEIEYGAVAFYGSQADACQDPALRDLFNRLAEMEREHAELLERRYHVSGGAPDTASVASAARIALRTGHDGPVEDEVSLLRLAIHLERRALRFFAVEREKLPEESPARSLYQELEAEEEEHVAMLSTELLRLQEGKPGIL